MRCDALLGRDPLALDELDQAEVMTFARVGGCGSALLPRLAPYCWLMNAVYSCAGEVGKDVLSSSEMATDARAGGEGKLLESSERTSASTPTPLALDRLYVLQMLCVSGSKLSPYSDEARGAFVRLGCAALDVLAWSD